jgi:putative ATP-dependent endonuclease of the OLD family
MHLAEITVHGYRAATPDPLTCTIPGRFAVLAGPNGAGKSTISDALLLAHRDVFPRTPRPSSATLSSTVTSRSIETRYDLDPTVASPLGSALHAQGLNLEWTTELAPSMGRVQASKQFPLEGQQLPVLYLTPTRDPSRELAGRSSRVIVELLRAQARRDGTDPGLGALRGKLSGLVSALVGEALITNAEASVQRHMAPLTTGVRGQQSYLASSAVDDAFLAQVFEFLLATVPGTRDDARRLHTVGLGHANLLQLAVVLAAIPDLTASAAGTEEAADRSADDPPQEPTDEELEAERELAEERRDVANDTFFADQFHATVLLEEPEAHLHPQLQHALVAHLRRIVEQRPEVQIVLTTHSDHIISACDPDELVVFAHRAGTPLAVTVRDLNMHDDERALARRHLDISRSASLFTDRLVMVEGMTDVAALRVFARLWADGDPAKTAFADALTITIVGSRIGSWLPNLIANPDQPIAQRAAVLVDTDGKDDPEWLATHESEHFGVFRSDPTLEPSITHGNEAAVASIINKMSPRVSPFLDETEPTAELVRDYFQNSGKGKKAEFADRLTALHEEEPDRLSLPEHLRELFDWLFDGFGGDQPTGDAEGGDDEPATADEPAAEGGG